MKDIRLAGSLSPVDKYLKTKQYLYLYWLFLSFGILGADYITGPLVRFPVLYLIPVGLASWYSGRAWGYVFSVGMPLIRLYFQILWDAPWTLFEETVNALIRIFVFTIFVYMIDKIVGQKRELEREIQILKGILPICSFCKKIRNKDENWVGLEDYIRAHSEAEFSHSLCPECAKKNYPAYIK